MGRTEALIYLGLSGQDFGPCFTDEWSYEEFSAAWRGSVPCPTEAAIERAKIGYQVVPKVVTMRQARLALLEAGLLRQVAGVIEAMSSPQKEAAQIEWEYSQPVERDRQLVAVLGPSLGLSSEQVDELFITAASL